MYLTFLQLITLVDRETRCDDFLVFPVYFMFLDWRLLCTATMFGGYGGWEMPFDMTCAGLQRDVVKIEDLFCM